MFGAALLTHNSQKVDRVQMSLSWLANEQSDLSMKNENTRLSETQKGRDRMISFTWTSQNI